MTALLATPPGMRVRTGRFEKLRLALCSLFEGAGVGLHHCPDDRTRLHRVPSGPLRQCGRLMPFPTHRHCGFHSFPFGPSVPRGDLLRPRLTSRSGCSPSPFQAQGEISPGKNALLHCTTAGFTPPTLDHESFAAICPLTLIGTAFYPVLVHRPTAAIHASSPHSVALVQLRFTSLTVTSL